MKFSKLSLIFISIMMLVSCSVKESALELTVVSYNIRYGDANDGPNSWEFRKHATPVMIDSLKPDLLGLQEALIYQIEYILENCPDYAFYGVGRDDGSSKGEHTAILYNKNVFTLLDGNTYWLSETPDVPSKGWDSNHHRTATIALLQHNETGRKVYYVNTHLDHEGVMAQKNGMAMIIDTINGLNTENHPVVLTGDFNMVVEKEPVQDLAKVLSNAREFAAETDNIITSNGWQIPSHGQIIDHIYYSPSGECMKYQTVDRPFAGVTLISDHFPILAKIRF